MRFGVFPLAAYVIGATPFGVILARVHGVDLRRVGSGNVGATNVARVLGPKWGYLCFALDVLKGLLPVALAGAMLQATGGQIPSPADQAAWLAVGLGAVLGHVCSFYLGFRGGKGVATALGVVLGMYPYFTGAGVVAMGLWVAVTLISRYVSLGSIVAAVAFVPLFGAFNYRNVGGLWPLLIFAGAVAALIVLRHRSNIRRLLEGTENKIGRVW
ncbi:MAG: glycerol-3-phosphate 1-O-acyltransferase PlsY [Phycisphaerae bacterium]|nr:glycerol-3-phosphate 1-O-acyltransferase PlsY [Phycisphaerae bacterium]